MSDLTVLYYTANLLPPGFASAVRAQLMLAVGDRYPIFCISQGPLDFGSAQINVGTIGPSVLNLYRQVLLGAKVARTPYVALCEDDTLYTPGHFDSYRPDLDTFAYNHNKWALYTWGPAVFSAKTNRSVLNQCIAPREQLVRALEERFEHEYTPERVQKHFAEPGRYERWLGVTIQKMVAFESPEPNIVISHEHALGFQQLGTRKALGDRQCERLDPWGTATEVRERFCHA